MGASPSAGNSQILGAHVFRVVRLGQRSLHHLVSLSFILAVLMGSWFRCCHPVRHAWKGRFLLFCTVDLYFVLPFKGIWLRRCQHLNLQWKGLSFYLDQSLSHLFSACADVMSAYTWTRVRYTQHWVFSVVGVCETSF